MKIQKEYTKEGVKLTHPSGVTQLITTAQIANIITYFEQKIDKLTKQMDALIADRTKILGA